MDSKENKGRNATLGKYAYYSGIGFQMIAIIGLFTFIGHRLDAGLESSRPIWTAILALIGVCISIYTTLRMVLRKRPEK